ncbi:MAG: hypothetical protein EXS09_15610 [Gemmataceae bacterium]|nr:hypothetical protein [Gemmataceae bacterium]
MFQKSRLLVALALCIACGCDKEKLAPEQGTAKPIAPVASMGGVPASSLTIKASEVPSTTPERVAWNQPSTNGQVRVSIKKVSIGKVALKELDGTLKYLDEPRLMIALKIENMHEKRKMAYHTWVPDLDAAKTFGRLVDDSGYELKRITFGFGNNVKDRTVFDEGVNPGKVISDLLVFELPPPNAKHFDLDLPGTNCGQRGTYQFRIEMKDIAK